MPVLPVAPRLSPTFRSALLAGVSGLALLTASVPARALPLTSMRGGGGGAATVNAAAAALASVQQAQQATQLSMSSLMRATQAIQAMQQAQTTARALAQQTPSGVPNGLVPGGLQIAPNVGIDPSLWQNANLPSQSVSGGQTTVTIQQTAQKAILTWSQFNVGKNTTVYFDQTRGNSSAGNDWIALNRVIDPSGVPSQILGSIKAEGSVYVINQNGIVFGGSSQVNVNSLLASSLPFMGDPTNLANMGPGSAGYDAAVQLGNSNFLNVGIAGTNGHVILGSNSYQPADVVGLGNITVEPGAQIEVGSLGYALLAAPNVSNAGTIEAANGQAILAAGTSLSLNQPTSAATSAWLFPVMTDFMQPAGKVDVAPLFTATNTGLIEATTGNVTLTGGAVNQMGVIAVTTGVSRPGAITITAVDEFDEITSPERTGPVTFETGSVTAILPEEDGTTTISTPSATASFVAGKASISGGSVTFQNGSLLDAPGASVSVTATAGFFQSPSDPTVASRIYIDNGAVIDVAGLPNVELPVADTLVTIGPLTANDLADSPLDRSGFLIGQTVVIDSTVSGIRADGEAWVGSPIIDAQGYVGDMPRTIDQMLVNGGSINLAGGEIITAPGSVLNLMGGYIHYLSGTIETTRLIDATGQLVDISQADPDDPIVGFAGKFIVDHPHWGITQFYTSQLLDHGQFVPDYIQGGNAGTLKISGTTQLGLASGGETILDGAILANAEAGLHQVAGGDLPSGGTFVISGAPLNVVIAAQGEQLSDIDPNFSADTSLLTAANLAKSQLDPGNILYTSTLSAPLLDSAGFSSINISSVDALDVEAPLSVAPGGSINLSGGSVEVGANLTAPGGTISMTGNGYTVGTDQFGRPAFLFAGNVTVDSGVTISTAGRWINDTGLFSEGSGPANINGGTISISTIEASVFGKTIIADLTGAIDLQQGSVLDVSSGGYVTPQGQFAQTSGGMIAGQGGSISLQTYVEPGGKAFGTSNGPPMPSQQPTQGTITLDGVLRGYGFSGGGTLTLRALGIQIGGAAPAEPYDLMLPGDFFSQGGFGAYNLAALYDATVVAGTTVTVSERNFIPTAALQQAPTGSNLYGAGVAAPDGSLVSIGAVDPYFRQAANFSLTAGGFENWGGARFGVTGTLLIDQGASILADPGASVALASNNQVTELGTIVAHGGSISLTSTPTLSFNSGTNSVWLGANAVLDTSGIALIDPFAALLPAVANGLDTSKVLDGGAVSLLNGDGYVVAQSGAVIDVSGAAATFDILQSARELFRPVVYAPANVWSNAGSITLGGAQGLLFDGTLLAQAGAPEGDGGTLTLSAAQYTLGASFKASDIILQQSGNVVPAGLTPGVAIRTRNPNVEVFSVDRLDGSGIDSLVVGVDPVALAENGISTSAPANASVAIGFAGNVSIDLGRSFIADGTEYVALKAGATCIPSTLVQGQSSVGGTTVSISAPYVDLGGAALTPPALAAADATLSVHATTLDFTGFIPLEHFATADFVSTGDTRFYNPAFSQNGTIAPGYLMTPGNLVFQAAQLYPATGNTFVIDAVGPTVNGTPLPTTVTILPNGASSVPLSAGGSLLIDATTINQEGTIRAPSGSIVLGVSNPTSEASAFDSLPLVTTNSVTLAPGSLTSVSLDGITVPYGTTVDGTDWQYQIFGVSSSVTLPDLTDVPAKSISLGGNAIALNPGATIDLSGGGTVQASEFVSGTGGSRNLLLRSNVSYANGATPINVPLYPDDRAVYAILPGYNSAVAPVDPEMAPSGAATGQRVYLSGIPGLPAGVYTLLPAQYATLPGAYRVVQQTGTIDNLASQNVILPDGSAIVAGSFVDGLTGGSASRTTSFLVQSQAVWEQYSRYTISNANSYFAALAAKNGTTIPRLPMDAGALALTAATSLSLGATLDTAAGSGGRGATVDIASQAIQIVGNGEAPLSGYLQISADSLDALDAESLLIGGTRTTTASGITIDPIATSVVVSNDANDPLSGPEIILVTAAGSATGLKVESGSVIEAVGSITGAPEPITIGQNANGNGVGAVSGDGSLLAVSNAGIFQIARNDLPANAQGLLTIAPGATLSGGAGLTLDSSGSTLVDPSAILSGTSIAADAGLVTFVTGDSAPANSGLVIGATTLAQFANAQNVMLRSFGAIDFEGAINVDVANNLVLSAGTFESGAAGDSGSVSIRANTLTLTNDLNAAPPTAAAAGPAVLNLAANEIDFGTSGSTLQSTSGFSGFSSVNATAVNGIVGQGSGTFDFGIGQGTAAQDSYLLPVTLTAPKIIAGTNSNATLQTAGDLVLNTAAPGGATSAESAFGGAITLIGGSLEDNTLVQAAAGNVTLKATTGDLSIDPGATVNVAGIAKQFFDVTAFAPAGALTLVADKGNVNVATGARLDFAGAAGGGAAGSLTLSAPAGAVTLDGTLQGNAAAGYAGGSFTLNTGGAIDLDLIASELATSGVTKLISVTTGSGNLVLDAGNNLTANTVTLIANGGTGSQSDTTDGNVTISGAINADGTSTGSGAAEGGTINLYGKSSVDLQGSLMATSSDAYLPGGAANPNSVALGGTVVIGTSGTPTPSSYNATYGYENISATTNGFGQYTSTGAIILGANARIDVSGGGALTEAVDGLAGGNVLLRAPLLVDGTVPVIVNMTNPAGQIVGSRATTLEGYAVWSTTDAFGGAGQPTAAQHFDGIVDPAGWYGDSVAGAGEPNLVAGAFANAAGKTVATWDGSKLTNDDGTTDNLSYYLSNDFFTPTSVNTDHQAFYGYQSNGTTPGTLMGFVENLPISSATRNLFGNLHIAIAPGIELDNPTTTYNNGNISILTNWNLGAGASAGSLAYRYNGQAPFITFRAEHDVQVDASLTDGFFQVANPFGGIHVPTLDQYGTFAQDYILYNKNAGYNGLSIEIYASSYSPSPVSGPINLTAADPTEVEEYYALYAAYGQLLDQNLSPTLVSEGGLPSGANYLNLIVVHDLRQGAAPQGTAPTAPTWSAQNATNYAQQYLEYIFVDYPQYVADALAGSQQYIAPPAAPAAQMNIAPFSGKIGPPPVTDNTPSPVATASNPLPLLTATLNTGSSASYRIVAGANFSSVDPLSLQPASAGGGSVTLDGHFSYLDTDQINAPTMIRTGTGSIDIAAVNDVDWQDNTAPAVIYTAGEPASGIPVQTAATLPPNQTSGEFIVTGTVQPVAAGDITITAGQNIEAIEQVYDTTGAVTGSKGTFVGQLWWQWLSTGNPLGGDPLVGTASSINFGAFDQGVMSVGGNVTMTAGGDIKELSVSLPTTWGGTINASGAPNTFGGGNLTVTAGGNILSGTYFVADGTGTITAGGAIAPDFTVSGTYQNNSLVTSPVSMLLGYENAALTVTARENVDIGGVYDPSYFSGLVGGNVPLAPTANSSLSIQSTVGDASVDTMVLPGALLQGNITAGMVLPASVDMTALNGNVAVDGSGELYPSPNGQLTLLADQSIELANTTVGLGDNHFGLLDVDPADLPSATNQTPLVNELLMPQTPLARFEHVTSHALDPDPVRIYALDGDIVDGVINAGSGGLYADEVILEPNKPAFIEAGRDIVNLDFLGQNYNASDVTRVIAGRDILDTPLETDFRAVIDHVWVSSEVPAIELAGPGYFDVEAGRDIGPLTSANAALQFLGGSESSSARPDAIITGIQTVGDLYNAALPPESAAITVLFGIAPGLNDAGFAATYIDPLANAIPGIPSLAPELVTYVEQIEKDKLTRSGLDAAAAPLTPAQAWAIFQALPQYQQQAFIDQEFFAILTMVGTDYNNSASPFFHQYARGYQAINTLFPASFGYTQNNLGGGTNGANSLVSTGTFDMRGATVQTQEGGNVNILGPGGRILVGSVDAPPFVVNSMGQTVVGPNEQGILTLETGDVDIFSDQSLLLAQSRIFTEQGGDMTIWSSNGDINAGEGAKTTSDVPPPEFKMDPDAYFLVNPASEVTGAGIATLQTIPGAPRGNVDLIAPRGTVDAGAAGIRVSGNLNIAALRVLNAFNIQVQGVSTGVPTATAPNIGALDSASSASGAATKAITATGQGSGATVQPSILIVTIEGYGGDDGTPVQNQQNDRDRKKQDKQSYNPNSAVQFVGLGEAK
ncbi:MAG: filamentous hemagglutinin family protein [Pseudomonadota bacterium]